MDERRKKELCYNCDEKWGPRHKCKNVKLFLLEGIDIVPRLQFGVQITEVDEEVDNDLNKPTEQEEDVRNYIVYFNWNSYTRHYKGKGKINGSGLVILVDTGSTHNFVDALLVSSLQ